MNPHDQFFAGFTAQFKKMRPARNHECVIKSRHSTPPPPLFHGEFFTECPANLEGQRLKPP